MSIYMYMPMATPTPRAQMHIVIDAALMKELEEWIKRQKFPPSRTAVVEAALWDFLERNKDSERRKR